MNLCTKTMWLESKGLPLKQGNVIKRYIILNGTTHINKTHVLMKSLTLPHFNGVLDSTQLMECLTLSYFKGVLDSNKLMESLTPPHFNGVLHSQNYSK